MKEIHDSIAVPFVSEDLVERAESAIKSDIEALLQAEFGEADEFIITPNQVKIGDKTLIDLNADAVFENAALHSKKVPPNAEALRDFNRPSIPAAEDAMVFTSRVIQNRNTLRIAVHSDLVQLFRPAVNTLMADIRKKREENIEIDLSHCRQISLTGIGVLLLVKENARHGCCVTIKNCSPEVSKKLHWANLDSVFTINSKVTTSSP